MPLRRKPIRRDGSRSIGAMETVQINRMLGRRAHDVDDFIDAQKSRAKRKTVQLDSEFFGTFLDFGRKSVQTHDRRYAECFEFVEIVDIGHGTDKKRIDIAEIAWQCLRHWRSREQQRQNQHRFRYPTRHHSITSHSHCHVRSPLYAEDASKMQIKCASPVSDLVGERAGNG